MNYEGNYETNSLELRAFRVGFEKEPVWLREFGHDVKQTDAGILLDKPSYKLIEVRNGDYLIYDSTGGFKSCSPGLFELITRPCIVESLDKDIEHYEKVMLEANAMFNKHRKANNCEKKMIAHRIRAIAKAKYNSLVQYKSSLRNNQVISPMELFSE